MTGTRRGPLGSAAVAASALPLRRARAQRPVLRIGVMNGMSGTYRDVSGPTSVICARFAVQEPAITGSMSRCRPSGQAGRRRGSRHALFRPGRRRRDPGRRPLQGQASGAKVIGFANAGADLVNCIKQAHEFGVGRGDQKIAALLCYSTDIHAIGLDTAQGLLLSGTFDWNLNDRTPAWMSRIRPQVTLWPSTAQAGQYSSALHYMKAAADLGPAAAKADGAATVARMKAMPTDDDCFGSNGRIREDGRKLHPGYLFQAKAPAESKSEWDLLRPIAVTPAEEAFRPLSEHACPMLKA